MRILVPLLSTLLAAGLFPGCKRQVESPPEVVAAPPGAVRVVSWNLEWFPGHSPHPAPGEAARHLDDVLEAMKRLQPDVLLLQEVSEGPALEALVAGLPGFRLHTVSGFGGLRRLAIAGRLPAESAWSEGWKKDGTDDPPRGFAYAGLRLVDGRLLMTYTVHLKSNSDEGRAGEVLKAG